MRERRVFGVDVLHYVGDFLRIKASSVLKPYDAAVDSAIVAIWPQLVCQFLQHLILAAFYGVSPVCCKLMREKLPFSIEVGPEDVGLVAGL